MNKAIFIVSVLFTSLNCLANSEQTWSDTLRKRPFKTLYILHIPGKPALATTNYYPDASLELKVQPLEDIQYKPLRKLLQVDYIINVELKKGTNFLTLNDVLFLYKIPAINRKLPVVVDEKILDYPETVIVSKNQIESVKLVKSKSGKFINIILHGYFKFKKDYEKHKNDPDWSD